VLNVKEYFIFYKNVYDGLNVKKILVIFAALICMLVSANLWI